MSEFFDSVETAIAGLKAGNKRVGLRNLPVNDTEALEIASVLANSECATERLSIVNGGLNANRMIPILAALKTNTHLQYLNLNNNGGGSESAKVLAETLNVNTSLTEVFLGNNNIWEEGALVLLRSLECSQSVQIMDLDGNTKIEKSTLKKIAAAVDNNL